jgi:hypothetical protein
MSYSALWDRAERAVWTLLQVVTAGGIVAFVNGLSDSWDVPVAAVPLIAAALSWVKAAVAQRFGNGTAATLPADVEPVYQAGGDH